VADLFRHIVLPSTLVIHAAAQPSHDWAAKAPFVDFSINAIGTLNLLEATRQSCPDACLIFTGPNRLPLVELASCWELLDDHPYGRHAIDEAMSIDQTMHSLFGASKVARCPDPGIWALFRRKDGLLPRRFSDRSRPFWDAATRLSRLSYELRSHRYALRRVRLSWKQVRYNIHSFGDHIWWISHIRRFHRYEIDAILGEIFVPVSDRTS